MNIKFNPEANNPADFLGANADEASNILTEVVTRLAELQKADVMEETMEFRVWSEVIAEKQPNDADLMGAYFMFGMLVGEHRAKTEMMQKMVSRMMDKTGGSSIME